MNARELIEQCRAALAEEMAAYDIDPPIHHVKEAHDNCVAWLSSPAAEGEKVADLLSAANPPFDN